MNSKTPKGGRKPTGTVQKTKSGLWQGIITLADGSRKRLPPFPKGTSKEMAQEKTRAKAEQAAAMALTRPQPKHNGEPPAPGAQWWQRYMEYRRELGLTSINGMYERHIKPVIDKPWQSITVADCERLRDALDTKARAGEIAFKTAFNAWACWTTASKAASGTWKKDKPKRMKVRDGDPCAGVAPPDVADPKELQWLYPDEFSKLVSCKLVPLEWRRRYAIAVYLFARGGELKALPWSDIDVERGIVSVRLAFDHERGVVKTTKTGNKGIRRFAIEPALLPLLRAMQAESSGQGNLIEMPALKWWAVRLREHLALAGVRREALFVTDATRKRLRFHDLRSTGLTWMAIRGDDPLKIQQRAGHTNFETTQKYIRAAEEVGHVIGEVFPELPAELTIRSPNRSEAGQLVETIVEASGIEPESARHPINLHSRT